MTIKEYTIFITCRGGIPYCLCTFKSFAEALSSLENMINLERERNRPYYVFNDFFENEYPASINGKTYCIKERTVTEWQKYSHYGNLGKYSNNVYQFPNIF